MEVVISETAPVLRVMTDISEIKNPVQGVYVFNQNHDQLGEIKERDTVEPNSNKESPFRQSGQAYPKKKFLHPIYGSNPYRNKPTYSSYYCVSNPQNNVSAFTQRIMSAKLLRVKQLQNQLSEAQSQLNDLINENRVLKALHKRQDNALKKYEGSQEQLPQLIKSHNEEMRVLNSKYKQLRMNYRDLENKLKQRDSELMSLREQHKHLLKLSKDKQLWDREKLTKKLEAMEITVKEQQQKIQLLNRKVELEGKNYRHQLNLELNKHKETHNQLSTALETIESLKMSAESREKFVLFPKKFQRPAQHTNMSLPGPARVSIRQTPQRLVHSEIGLQDGNDTATDSSMSTVTYGHGLQGSSQEDHSDDALVNAVAKASKMNGTEPQRNHIIKTTQVPLSKGLFNNSYNSSNDDTYETASRTKLHRKKIPLKISELKITSSPTEGSYLPDMTRSQLKDNWPSFEKQSGPKFDCLKSDVLNKNQKKPANVSFGVPNQNGDHESSKEEDSLSSDSLSNGETEQDTDESHKKTENQFGSKFNGSTTTESKDDLDYSPKINSPKDEDFFPNYVTSFHLKAIDENSCVDSELKSANHTKEDSQNVEDPIEDNLANLHIGTNTKSEVEEDINKLVEEACKGILDMNDSDVEREFKLYESISWDELKGTIDCNKEEMLKVWKDVEGNITHDVPLGENQKADLLKALNEIDEEEKNSEIAKLLPKKHVGGNKSSDIVERLHQGKPVYSDIKISVLEKLKKEEEENATKSDKTKKKTNIMKEIFGDKDTFHSK